MSSRQDDLVVMLDAPELGAARAVGVLTRWPGPVLSVGFQYAASWLRSEESFPIDPSLPLVEYQTTIGQRRLPGIFSDTAPEIQEAVRRFEEDPDAEMDEAIAQLLIPGSSLGGARPKANFRDTKGQLWIAKFPARTDRRDVGAWEHVYARLAAAAGIGVPDTDLLSIGEGARTYVTRRFDPTPEGRRLYASALTLSGRRMSTDADYVDYARAVRGSVAADALRDDLAQLYRRMVFNVLASNRDDHPRNHGFLRAASGWRLAPAFDMNPAREMREHATAVDGRRSDIGVDDLHAVRSHFGLVTEAARMIVREVGDTLGTWREIARATGISRAEQDRVGSVITLPAAKSVG